MTVSVNWAWNNSADLKAWIVPRWGAACCAPYKRGEHFSKQLLLLWIAEARQHERASMDGGGDDDADADGHGADQDGQGHVVFLHDFFPQVIGRGFVDDYERQDENKDAYECEGQSADYIAERTRFMLFASCVVVIAAVDRAIRTRIVAYGPGNVFDFVHGVHAPAAILRHGNRAKHEEPIDQIQLVEHQSLSDCRMGWSLSDQRARSKLMDLKVTYSTGRNKASKA